ncbi:sensor histidine kinase [Kitasatospora sp. NPDC056446]|uniref:sensor histidine kinase n=1 Tax=Kitasatospora sp. NPDC056446 TaxID=3345819 RepID=UPI0036BD19E0
MTRRIARAGRPAGAGLLAVAAISAAVTGSSSISVLLRCSTVVAVLAAAVLVVWSPGRPGVRVLAAVPVACAVSLYVTSRYQGPADNTSALWMVAESVALLAVTVPAVRGPGPVLAAAVALVLSVTTALLPLRIALTIEPPAGPGQTIGLCVVWGLVAVAAVGASCYLRSLDSRRRLAVVAERRAQRLHVARELHDFAAHDVTGVMVLAQAARLLAKESPERALALLPQIESAGVQALESMDRTIRILGELAEGRRADRGEDGVPPGPAGEGPGPVGVGAGGRARSLAELPALVERFGRTGVIPARLDLAPDALDILGGLPEEVGSVGYRVVVEALTNVRRHAPASPRVVVTAERVAPAGTGPVLRVVVGNEPAPPGARPDGATVDREGGGTGIRELARRVAGLGGELTAGPAGDGGWRVTVTLPLDGPRSPAPAAAGPTS